MSFVLATPGALATAASNVADMGSTIKGATTAAAAHTNSLAAAAADEVSAQIAALFSAHGLEFQQLSAQAAAFHEQFVQTLTASLTAYTAAETSTTQALGSMSPNAVLAPTGGSAAMTNAAAASGPYLPYLPYTGIGLLDRLIFGINSLLFQIDLLAFRFILS
jgi:PE family